MRFRLHCKTPLPIVLGIILNLILVVALEVLLVYRFPAPPESVHLAQVDPTFEGCTVVMTDTTNREQFLLAKRTDGRTFLVPSKTHPFFINRCRIYEKEIKEADDRVGTQAFRLGIRIYQVTAYPDHLLVQPPGIHMGQQSLLAYYLGLSGLLTLIELGILEKLRGE